MKHVRSLTVVVFFAGAIAAFAGEAEPSPKNAVVPAPPALDLYGSHELQFDLFGAYAPSGPGQGRFLGDHAWGGGSAINYYFTRHFGVGLSGEALDGTGTRSSHVSGDFGLSLLARYPIGSTGWAPYALGGLGGFVPGGRDGGGGLGFNGLNYRHGGDDDVRLEGRVGLGLEYRFTRHLGAFTEGGYTFVDGRREDFGLIRTGLRFSF